MRFLWPALQCFSEELGMRLHFHFWGNDLQELPALSSPTDVRPYIYPYKRYLQSLQNVNYDIVLSPLFDDYRIRQAKCPIKYLEITACGSIGIYSDVYVYRDVQDGVTGLKTKNTVEDWLQALKKAYSMSYRERRRMWKAAREQVTKEFTLEAQNDLIDGMLLAAQLQTKLAASRHPDGRSRIAYFSTDTSFMRQAVHIALRHGFQPICAVPSSLPAEPDDWGLGTERVYWDLSFFDDAVTDGRIDMLAQWIRSRQLAFIHSDRRFPALQRAALLAQVPYVCYPTGSECASDWLRVYVDHV
jgi:hypothetical protein